ALCALLCVSAPAVASAAPAAPYDFNGDGRGDLAVGVPGESVGKQDFAGAAAVLYSTATGLSTTGSQLWSQDSEGVHGSSEDGDRFASVVASGDFNGDGRADLAVGDPGEAIGSAGEAGAVNVVYGSASGLASARNQLWSQSSKGVPDSPEPGDRFGSSLAAGDLNGDGYADLVIGVAEESIKGTESAAGTGTGLVEVLYGSKAGLTSKRAQAWTQQSKGIRGSTEFNDEFGNALATGDVDGDGYADLAVGVHYENDQAGAVALIRGSKKGLTSKDNQLWSQNSPGVRDTAEPGDLFGESLAFGDFNHDGRADLAVGVPGEVVQTCPGSGDEDAECDAQGAVQVLLGTKKGLTAAGNQLWHVGDPGIPGTVTDVNSFGDRLTSGDFNGDGSADLAVTAPDANVGAVFGGGTVYVLDGSRNGLHANGFVLTQATPGVPGDPETVGGNGMNLASRRFGGAYDSLVVGMPGVTVDGQDTAGEVLVVPGSAHGLVPAGTTVLTQDTPGLADAPEDRDRFGEVAGGLER
ncbi:MAG: FG-GAP repeat protein, partial [Janthinobacterium lividum]